MCSQVILGSTALGPSSPNLNCSMSFNLKDSGQFGQKFCQVNNRELGSDKIAGDETPLEPEALESLDITQFTGCHSATANVWQQTGLPCLSRH